jgi:hypothetical protein
MQKRKFDIFEPIIYLRIHVSIFHKESEVVKTNETRKPKNLFEKITYSQKLISINASHTYLHIKQVLY